VRTTVIESNSTEHRRAIPPPAKNLKQTNSITVRELRPHAVVVGPSLGNWSFGSMRVRSFIISSHVTVAPRYAAVRPRIAVNVLVTASSVLFSSLPVLMLSTNA
jgi:hypothetical protein